MGPLQQRLRQQRVTSVLEISSGSAVAVELAAGLGFSALLLDARHAAVSPYSGELERLVRAADAGGIAALVRVPEATPGTINRALNDGAAGVVVCDIDTPADARAAVAAARYPPHGHRGAAPVVRAAGLGLERWPAYHARTRELAVLASVATSEQLAGAAALAGVEGLDGVLLEVLDLALAGGARGGEAEARLVTRLDGLRQTVSVLKGAGKVVGATATSAAGGAALHAAGVTLVVLQSDLAACARETVQLRASLGRVPRALASGSAA